MLYIGNHTTSSKGYENMARQMIANGGNTFAFFTRNPRGAKAKALDVEDVNRFLERAGQLGIGPIVAHAPYTLNACGAEERVREFALETMADDLARMEYLPGNYYNFHPGSHVKQGAETGIRLIAETLNAVLKPEQHTTVLLETMAGKGSEVGRSFEELRAIIDRVELTDKLGVCLDTITGALRAVAGVRGRNEIIPTGRDSAGCSPWAASMRMGDLSTSFRSTNVPWSQRQRSRSASGLTLRT